MALERLSRSELAGIALRVQAGGRLERRDCLQLWATQDHTGLGALANFRREQLWGDRTFIRIVLHCNLTGGPVPECTGCSRQASAGTPPTRPEAESWLDTLPYDLCGELHLSCRPDARWDLGGLCSFIDMARRLRPALRVRALTWEELGLFAAATKLSPAVLVRNLAEAGLSMLAGGAVVPGSLASARPWFDAAAACHIKTDLIPDPGAAAGPEEAVDFLMALREVNDHSAVMHCLAPAAPAAATAHELLRLVALNRLILDNVPHVQLAAGSAGEPLLQIAQWYGADAAECPVAVAPGSSGARTGASLPATENLRRLAHEAQRRPVDFFVNWKPGVDGGPRCLCE